MQAGVVSRAANLPFEEKASRVEHLWIYGYGIFQGAASVVDQFTVFFTVAVLGAAPGIGNITDAVGNLGFAVGSAAIAAFITRFVQHKGFMVLVLGTAALPVFFISAVNGLLVFFILVFAFEILWGPVNSMAQAIAMQTTEKSGWGAAFARLNESDALGSMAGLAIAGLWMGVSQNIHGEEGGARALFIFLGASALLGALVVRYGLSSKQSHEMEYRGYATVPNYSKEEAKWLPTLFSDQLFWFYALSFVLFLGLGMSYSGILTFMVGSLHFPIAGALIALFGFKIATYATSHTIGGWIEKVMPLQIHSLASLCRAVIVLLLAIMAFLVHSSLAFPGVLAIILIWGALSAIMSVTGLLVPATLAPNHKQSQALSVYNAITNAAVILGAAMAGGIGAGLGFETMFLVASALIAIPSLLFLRV